MPEKALKFCVLAGSAGAGSQWGGQIAQAGMVLTPSASSGWESGTRRTVPFLWLV
jgi:hypothetical protein